MSAVEVWLPGGPAHGSCPWNVTGRGHLPELVVLPQTGVFVGAADEPSPPVEYRYRRGADIDGQPVYRYEPAVGAGPVAWGVSCRSWTLGNV